MQHTSHRRMTAQGELDPCSNVGATAGQVHKAPPICGKLRGGVASRCGVDALVRTGPRDVGPTGVRGFNGLPTVESSGVLR